MVDTGASDSSLLPHHLGTLDPNGELQPYKWVTYELADGRRIDQRVYILDTRISKANGTIIVDWRKELVAVEANNNMDCLAGMDVFNACYSASNPGGLGAPDGGT